MNSLCKCIIISRYRSGSMVCYEKETGFFKGEHQHVRQRCGFDSCNVCILIQRNTNNPPSATSGLEISRPSSFLPLSLNPSSHLYPLPLISECFLSPRGVVVKTSCYEMVQSFKTLIHHQLSYATRRFQSAVFSCGDFSGVTVMELEKQGDTSRSQLHVINEVIK